MKRAVIFDIDGTLSNPVNRLDYITGAVKNWQAFYEDCEQDTLHVAIKTLLDDYVANGYAIVLMTGRIESVRAKTEKWLKSHNISYDLLLMRQNGDFSKDYEMKGRWVDNLPNYHFITAYDDMTHNIEVFRTKGIDSKLVLEGMLNE